MPKKNKKAKAIDFGQIEETSATSDHLTESAAAGEEAVKLPDPNPDTNEEASIHEEAVSGEESKDEVSEDDLLDDVRRSLIEDATHADEKQSKWWKRIGKGSRKEKTEVVRNEPLEEAKIPIVPVSETIVEKPDILDTDVDPIDELIEMLESETEHDVEKAPPANVVAVAPEPEKIIDVEELKKHAFAHRENEKNEDLSEVRSIALAGEDEVFVEVESTRQDPLEERLKSIENALKPYRSFINLTVAFLGIVMAVIAAVFLYNFYMASLPAKPAEEVSNLPYPTAVSLPGGWSFNLAKGSLVDGQWNPRGAEWLQGTEVCRWVALPWNRQLEAVVRTLNPNDPIELTMSNQDKLVYEVYSLRQMSPEEMQKLDSNSPCLLIVLAEADSEKRWVLTALP